MTTEEQARAYDDNTISKRASVKTMHGTRSPISVDDMVIDRVTAGQAQQLGHVSPDLISPSEACIGLALALHIHLLNPEQTSEVRARAESVHQHVFDENCGALNHDLLDLSAGPNIDWLLCTICRIMVAFQLQEEVEVLVSALILVERFIRKSPGSLTVCTLRPLLLTAVWLSTKHHIDEQLCGIVAALTRIGFTNVDHRRCCRREAAFLLELDWHVGVSKKTHTLYALELRALAFAHLGSLRALDPRLIQSLELLDRPACCACDEALTRHVSEGPL